MGINSESRKYEMEAVNAIIPVIFMLALGWLARRMQILSAEHNAGLKKLIFSILLPILVFNATFTLSVDARYMQLTAFMLVLQCVTLALGFFVFRLLKSDYSHLSPYMMTTIEGGNAFYPLYIGLVGAGFSSYFVLLDIPGIFVVFLIIPLLLAKLGTGRASLKEMLRNVYTNPVIVGLLAGLLLNVLGISKLLAATKAYEAYSALVSAATAPIAPLILFTLGYSFSIGRGNLLPMVKTLIVRLLLMGAGIAAAFVLFPWIRADRALTIAVILFLLSPPAFAYPIILEPLYRDEGDGAFCSTYISLHMLVTVIAFAVLAIVM